MEAPRQKRALVDRAMRHDLRIPLRYRRPGQDEWSPGETINISQSGLLFSSDQMIELDSTLEITFQTTGNPLLKSSTRQATVVRRMLSNWPDTRIVLGAKFSV